jgi:hypothetical protein
MSESESVAMAGRLQPWCAVNEDDCVVNLLFLTQFGEKQLCECLRSDRIEPHMEQAVRVGIDGGVQPIALGIELNHGLIDCNVIRVGTACRL